MKISSNLFSKISVRVCFYLKIINTPMLHALVQLVDALRYKPEGGGFDSRWCHWNLPLT